jgi:hypothetical protein
VSPNWKVEFKGTEAADRFSTAATNASSRMEGHGGTTCSMAALAPT